MKGRVGKFADRYFAEIGIYRLSREKFDRQYDKDLERYWENFSRWGGGDPSKVSRALRLQIEQGFWERYGGPWNFNQAVGWLRLFSVCPQIRAELWSCNAQHFVRRPRHRQISLMGTAFQIHCWPEQISVEILSELTAELERFQKEFRGGRCVLDLECFNTLAQVLDWRKLVYEDQA